MNTEVMDAAKSGCRLPTEAEAERTDWLPGRREQQLALAQNWLTVLQNQSGNPWNIPFFQGIALSKQEHSLALAGFLTIRYICPAA
jgi:hypothetical protein